MLNKIIAILCCISISSISFAGCQKPVQYIKKDDPAFCEGYLFSIEKEKEIRVKVIENDYLKLEIENKNKLINFYKEQEKILYEISEEERKKSKLWRDMAEESTLKLTKIERRSDLENVLWFVGGIFATVASGYAIGQASK